MSINKSVILIMLGLIFNIYNSQASVSSGGSQLHNIDTKLLGKVKTALLGDWLKIKQGGHIGSHFASNAPAVANENALPGYDQRPKIPVFDNHYNTKDTMLALVKEVINSSEFKARGVLGDSISVPTKAGDFKKIFIYGKGNDGKEYIFLFHKGYGIETGYPSNLEYFEGAQQLTNVQ